MPTPAPIATYANVEVPLASPFQASPSAARLTLFSISTGTSNRLLIAASGSRPPSGLTL